MSAEKHWQKFCDELVISGENDQELKQTRQYLDAMIGNIDKSKQSHVV